MNLFTVKDGEVTFNHEIVRLIPEFNFVYRKRMPTTGDSEGRDKILNLKVFMYIFYMAEWRQMNPIAGLPDVARIEKAVELSGLPISWKADKEIQKAIERYVEIICDLAPSARLLIAAKRGIFQASAQILLAVEQNDRILEKIKAVTDTAFAADIASPDYARNMQTLQTMTTFFRDNSDSLTKLVKDMSTMHKTVESFEKDVAQQVEETMEIYGGGVINPRELPMDQRSKSALYS